jgi:CHAT domain-containing protein/tetratricopeptide (TPR) repeat protein
VFALSILFALLSAQTPEDPRVIVRQATLAVEGDSVAQFRKRWDARVRRNADDRAALLVQATLARLTYDYTNADKLYKQLLRDDSARVDRYAAFARLGFAQGLALRGYRSESEIQYERARRDARVIGDRLLEGEALITIAVIRSRTQGLAAEEVTFDSAASMFPDTAYGLHALILWRLAIVDALQGRPADARKHAEQSIALARRAGDLRIEADGHRALGQSLQYRGQWDSSLVALKQADSVYLRARCGCARSTALIFQAQVLGSLGRLGEMREALRAAMTEAEETHDPSGQATAYRGYAVLAGILGDAASALTYTKKAGAVSQEIGDSVGVKRARALLSGFMIRAGELQEAKALVLQQLDYTRTTGEASEQFTALRDLATITAQLGDWTASTRYLGEARALLPKLPGSNYKFWLMHDEGRLAAERGDLATAEKAFKEYVTAATDQSADVVRYDVRTRLADVYARRGDVARAESELASASADIDQWRARLTDTELRTLAFQVSATSIAAAVEAKERDARIARTINAIASAGRTATAFELAERRRGRELRDQLARAEALRTGCPAEGCPRALSKAMPEPRSASELSALIPNDATALVEFVGGSSGAPTTAFVLQRDRMIAITITPGDSLRERITRLSTLLESGASADALARQLGNVLLDPVLATLGSTVRNIVIIPDGALHNTPWDVLRTSKDEPAIQNYAISVAPSATTVATMWRASSGVVPARTGSVRVLAFGDPAISRAATLAISQEALPRLRASAAEARHVSRYGIESTVRTRSAANADNLTQAELGKYQVIHFATHAIVDEQNSARSALLLAPGANSNGLFFPGDLAALELNAALVVLSACRSARGVVVGGEGVQGLTAPLLQAGARAVLATQWRIDDRSTVKVIDDFYRSLAEGSTVTDALRSAKLNAIEGGAPPRTWAAFTIVGDPLVTVPLEIPKGGNWRWITIAAALFAIIASLAFALRRRSR